MSGRHVHQRRQTIEHPKWTIARARERFSELLRDAVHEPQAIYRRDELVGGVIDADTWREFVAWRRERDARTPASALAELRRICSAESYELEIPERRDRRATFGTDGE
jgi:hypothetical protein